MTSILSANVITNTNPYSESDQIKTNPDYKSTNPKTNPYPNS